MADISASTTGAADGAAAKAGGSDPGVTPPTGRGLVVRSVRDGARAGAWVAAAVWLGDLPNLFLDRGGATAAQWLTAAGAALFVAASAGAALGALLGPVLAPAMSDAWRRLRERVRSIRSGDAGARRMLAGDVMAAAALVVVGGAAAYRATFAIELDFARPESIAEMLTLSHLAFALALFVAWRPAVRVAEAVFSAAASVKWLRPITDRAWGVPLALAVVGAIAVTPSIVAHRAEIEVLEWRDALPLPIGLGVIATLFVFRDAVRRVSERRGARIAAAVLFVACAYAALRLRPESTTSRTLAFEDTMSGRIGYAAYTAAFDFDRDGQLSFFGGGDCAPFDPRRHTGAIDVPGNGIDEDCDGRDLPFLTIRPRPRQVFSRTGIPERPSIVLVTIDALAGPRLRVIGGGPSVMPNLDALAEQSMVFTHCFSQGPSTRLSFPSIFTSRWDSQLAQVFGPRHPYSLAPSERQLQDSLDEAGYDTTAVLPNLYFGVSRWPSITRGFQHVDSSAIPAGKYNAPQVTDAALRALSSAGEEPVYLWVHYYDAHGPYGSPPGMTGLHGEEAMYAGALTYIDREVGRLIDAVEARADPVYLFVTADHATVFHPNPSTRHGHYGSDLYTATLHVPLIVHGPGIRPGTESALVSTMDIAPTITDLLRVTDRTALEGTSLLPEIFANRRDDSRALFHELFLFERELHGDEPLEFVSVRESHYDLILDRWNGNYELYDWSKDYYEQHDLYEQETSSPEANHLRALLGSFLQQFDRRPSAAAAASPPPRLGQVGGAVGDER